MLRTSRSLRARRVVAALIVAALAAGGCAGMERPQPFGDADPDLPDKAHPEGSGAYHGLYVPGAVVGT
jgi:hypothetical protein